MDCFSQSFTVFKKNLVESINPTQHYYFHAKICTINSPLASQWYIFTYSVNIFTKFTEYIHYVPHHHPCPLSRSMDYYGNVPHYPYSHHLAPYAHVLHCPCALLLMYPISIPPCRSRRGTCHIAHMPHHPCSHE